MQKATVPIMIFLLSITACEQQRSVAEKSPRPTVAGESPRQTVAQNAHIEIIDWTNRRSGGGGYYYVEGVLKNTGNKIADNVKVTVKAMDKQGNLVSLKYGWAQPYDIYPNHEATFQVMVDYDSRIKQFSVSSMWDQ